MLTVVVQLNIDLYEDDFIWLDPGPQYGSTWDLCRPLADEDGEPIFIGYKQATADNYYILFDAANEVGRRCCNTILPLSQCCHCTLLIVGRVQWLLDLCHTPNGYGLACCNDKVTATGGIMHAAGIVRDKYREHELTVVGVSGGNRLYVAFFDAVGPATEVGLSCVARCMLPANRWSSQE